MTRRSFIQAILCVLCLAFLPQESTGKAVRSSHHQQSFAKIARDGQAALLLSRPTLASYSESTATARDGSDQKKLLELAAKCRRSYLDTGIAHIPHFVRPDVVQQMVDEATHCQQKKECFYSTDSHTVYQEPHDPNFSNDHPRNALQQSSKCIIDYARISKDTSPLAALYASPELRAFVAHVVRPHGGKAATELFPSGCDYNAAYYNVYGPGDGLGWHFDRSHFGINLELQRPCRGGDFELCQKTRTLDDPWCFDRVQRILEATDDDRHQDAQQRQRQQQQRRIQDPQPVGPGSLVLFSGSLNLHRVTPVAQDSHRPRINAIMTYETKPNQKPNAYSLQKFFGR